MKNVILLFLVLALSLPVVASAADAVTSSGKNLCILKLENCDSQAYTIQEILAKLESEVDKGTSVYSGDELRFLQAKLSDFQQLSANLTAN